MQERNAGYIVETVRDLANALADDYIGELDVGLEQTAIVAREDGNAVLMLCESNLEHKILFEIKYGPVKLEFLHDTMMRLGKSWQFCDKDIYSNMPYEKIPYMVEFILTTGLEYRQLDKVWQWRGDYTTPNEIWCVAKLECGYYCYREIDHQTGELLYDMQILDKGHGFETLVVQMTARAELADWVFMLETE